MHVILLAIAMFAAPFQTTNEEKSVNTLWAQYGPKMEGGGITKPMFRQFFFWTVQQSMIGTCEPYFDAGDVLYWRTWWKDTPIERSDIGRQMLLTANDAYEQGVRDRLTSPQSRETCVNAMAKWVNQMRALAASGGVNPIR